MSSQHLYRRCFPCSLSESDRSRLGAMRHTENREKVGIVKRPHRSEAAARRKEAAVPPAARGEGLPAGHPTAPAGEGTEPWDTPAEPLLAGVSNETRTEREGERGADGPTLRTLPARGPPQPSPPGDGSGGSKYLGRNAPWACERCANKNYAISKPSLQHPARSSPRIASPGFGKGRQPSPRASPPEQESSKGRAAPKVCPPSPRAQRGHFPAPPRQSFSATHRRAS